MKIMLQIDYLFSKQDSVMWRPLFVPDTAYTSTSATVDATPRFGSYNEQVDQSLHFYTAFICRVSCGRVRCTPCMLICSPAQKISVFFCMHPHLTNDSRDTLSI